MSAVLRPLVAMITCALLALCSVASTNAAISYRSSASNIVTWNAQWTVDRPAGAQEGDLLLACVSTRKRVPALAPAGWTLVREDMNASNVGVASVQRLYVKQAGSSEPASYTFTASEAVSGVVIVAAYTGVDPASPVVASSGEYRFQSGSPYARAPGLTVSEPGALLVGCYGHNGRRGAFPPTGASERTDRWSSLYSTLWLGLELSDEPVSQAGATGERAALDETLANYAYTIGQLVALREQAPQGDPVGTMLPTPIPASNGSSLYVSPAGSDSWPGTLSQPYKTVAKAVSVVQAGQRIVLREGVYSEGSSTNANVGISLNRGGSASQPVTLTAYPGERAVITRELAVRSDNWRLTGLVFDGGHAIHLGMIYVVSGADNVEISDNEITGGGAPNTTSQSGSGMFIEHNTTNVQVLGNRIHDNGTTKFHHGVYINGTGHLVANNLITSNYGYGIQCYPGCHSTIFTANTITGHGQSGIIIGSDGSRTSTNNLVVNNVVAFNTQYGIRDYWGGSVGSGNVVQRNLVWSNPKGAFWITGGITTSETTQADPLFVDRAGGDLTLQASSPALGIALSPYTPTVDYTLAARPQGAGPDLGAHER